MLIKELTERSGLTKDTIRFYEKKGLIYLDSKSRRDNNYKEYSEQALEKLLLISKLKGLGFTLNEIATFFELWGDEDASCRNLKYTLENKLLQINEQMIRLAELKCRLTASVIRCNSDDCEFEKTVPPVVTE